MAIVSSFGNDGALTDADKVLGTDVISGDTVNFELSQIRDYVYSSFSTLPTPGIDDVTAGSILMKDLTDGSISDTGVSQTELTTSISQVSDLFARQLKASDDVSAVEQKIWDNAAQDYATVVTGLAGNALYGASTNYTNITGALDSESNALLPGANSYATGWRTTAHGKNSVAQNEWTMARGDHSHAEGSNTVTFGWSSHAEGGATQAVGNQSHSEGLRSEARGHNSHARNKETIAIGENSSAVGYLTEARGLNSFTGGYNTKALGQNSFCFGEGAEASGDGAIVFGKDHSGNTGKYVFVAGESNEAINAYAIAIGRECISNADSAVSIGRQNQVYGNSATALGFNNNISGYTSLGLGKDNIIGNDYGVAIGNQNNVQADAGFALGKSNQITSDYAYALGRDNTLANSSNSAAVGYDNESASVSNYLIGRGLYSDTDNVGTTLAGRYNDKTMEDTMVFGIGAGTDDSNRKTVMEVHQDGRVRLNDLPDSMPIFAGFLWNDGGTLKISN